MKGTVAFLLHACFKTAPAGRANVALLEGENIDSIGLHHVADAVGEGQQSQITMHGLK